MNRGGSDHAGSWSKSQGCVGVPDGMTQIAPIYPKTQAGKAAPAAAASISTMKKTWRIALRRAALALYDFCCLMTTAGNLSGRRLSGEDFFGACWKDAIDRRPDARPRQKASANSLMRTPNPFSLR